MTPGEGASGSARGNATLSDVDTRSRPVAESPIGYEEADKPRFRDDPLHWARFHWMMLNSGQFMMTEESPGVLCYCPNPGCGNETPLYPYHGTGGTICQWCGEVIVHERTRCARCGDDLWNMDDVVTGARVEVTKALGTVDHDTDDDTSTHSYCTPCYDDLRVELAADLFISTRKERMFDETAEHSGAVQSDASLSIAEASYRYWIEPSDVCRELGERLDIPEEILLPSTMTFGDDLVDWDDESTEEFIDRLDGEWKRRSRSEPFGAPAEREHEDDRESESENADAVGGADTDSDIDIDIDTAPDEADGDDSGGDTP